MKKLFLIFLLIPSFLWAAPPTRIYTYTSGAAIKPDEVTANEDAIFNYLNRDIESVADNSITTTKILDGTIVNADISGSAAITYGKLNLSNSITNTDIVTSAGIPYSKLYFSDNIVAGDIGTGAVTSTEILNDTIVNADINTSAGIVDTKLATISTAGKVSGAALTSLSSIPSGAGQIPVANLGTGTGSSSNYLRGDGSWQSATSGFKVGSLANKDISESTRDTSYTGVGFTPQAVIFIASESNTSNGFDDGTTHSCSYWNGTGFAQVATHSIYFYESPANIQTGYIKSLDADGFTITWTKTGDPSGTGVINYLAFK